MHWQKRWTSYLIACICAATVTAAAAVEPRPADLNPTGIMRLRSLSSEATVLGAIASQQPTRLKTDNPILRRLSNHGSIATIASEVRVYSNEIDPIMGFYTPGAYERVADDLELVSGACDLMYYNLAVYGEGVSGPFDVTVALYDGNPCESGSSMIAGTEVVFYDVPNDGSTVSLLEVTLDPAVEIPPAVTTVWLAATFSANDAGWIIAEEAETGFTDDSFSEGTTSPCLYWFSSNPYAGFWANISCDITSNPPGACCTDTTCTEVPEADCVGGTWLGAFTTCDPNPCLPGACCTGFDFSTCIDTTEAGCAAVEGLFHPLLSCGDDPCLAAFKVFENDFDVGTFDTIDSDTKWADDLLLGPGAPCELAAYDITMLGVTGSPDFDVHVELWTNDDAGTPEDPIDDMPLAVIPGTSADFTGVRADQMRYVLLAGPFSGVALPERVWVVFSTSSNQAGPLLAGMADIGFTRDAFAIFNEGGSGTWANNIWYGGFVPDSCPGQPPGCVPAGSFQVNVWCSGQTPTGACCNDAAVTCIDGVTEMQCDGRWVEGATCASNPFNPPCGTSACCTIAGCSDLTSIGCEELGQMLGHPAAFIPGSFCNDQGFVCPRNECLGASGSCFVANGTPGCEDPFCCDAICAIDERCCTDEWDDVCAEDAVSNCDVSAANDNCADAEVISGEGVFDFNNTTATTDGPPHDMCTNVDGDAQITHDVWYCWTAPCTDTVLISTCNLTLVDTKIAVYEGCDTCPPTDDNLLTCNDDACNSFQSQVAVHATAGQSYLIRIGTFPGGGGYPEEPGGIGQFSITCGAPYHPACPGTGDCCSATEPYTPGCEDQACCQLVCAFDPYCCETEWDVDCATNGYEDNGFGAAVLCSDLCGSGDCPGGTIEWMDPPDGVVDARQPYPPDDAGLLQGIDSILVGAPTGADRLECWSLCEANDGGSPNEITSVVDSGRDTVTIHLLRPITPGAVTTITYEGTGSMATFISHPANVNGDSSSAPTDILALIDCCLNQVCDPDPTWGEYSCDVDHSEEAAPADILRVIDLLNGADALDPWLGVDLPDCGNCCP